MSVEQVARDFIMNMKDPSQAQSMLTPDATFGGGILPGLVPAAEAFSIIKNLITAFPDLKFDILQVAVNGNDALVNVVWSGTNTGPLAMPMPGLAAIQPTGKQVAVKDAYRISVMGDKVSKMMVESPADGGIPAAMKQMGVNLPTAM
jgi:hypothetical protein